MSEGALNNINTINLNNISNFQFPDIATVLNLNKELNKNKTNTINNIANREVNLPFAYTNEKAGMEGINKSEIDRIITQLTKDSAISLKKQEDLKRIEQEVAEYKTKIEQLHKNELVYESIKKLANSKLKEIENERNLNRIWMHIDMDMFYAAIEIRDQPELENKLVAVGDERMISTSNYVARKYGVRSAMPGFIAKKICDHFKVQLTFIKPNFKKYNEESNDIMNILRQYDLNIDIRGLDEAYLDITDYCKGNYVSTEEEIKGVVEEIKKKIKDKTKLTSSCGIASNKLLAKICSDVNKPNGLYYLSNNKEEILNFVKNLKVRKVNGVGEKLEHRLNLLNIFTCEDVLNKYVELFHIFNENSFSSLIGSCLGIGQSFHEKRSEVNKTLSQSNTFNKTNDENLIKSNFEIVCHRLYEEMVKSNYLGKTLTVEFTDMNEKHTSKAVRLNKMFETVNEIIQNGWKTLKEIIKDGIMIRLVRVKLSNLVLVNPNVFKKKQVNQIKDMMIIMKHSVENNPSLKKKTKSVEKVEESAKQEEQVNIKRVKSVQSIKSSNKKSKDSKLINNLMLDGLLENMKNHSKKDGSCNKNNIFSPRVSNLDKSYISNVSKQSLKRTSSLNDSKKFINTKNNNKKAKPFKNDEKKTKNPTKNPNQTTLDTLIKPKN